MIVKEIIRLKTMVWQVYESTDFIKLATIWKASLMAAER